MKKNVKLVTIISTFLLVLLPVTTNIRANNEEYDNTISEISSLENTTVTLS